MMTKMELKGSDPSMWFKALNIEVLTGFWEVVNLILCKAPSWLETFAYTQSSSMWPSVTSVVES